jgi:predicted LPLAT superfamily acyltransferase
LSGDASQPWLEQRERGSVLGMRLVAAASGLLGRALTRVALAPVCLYFLLFSVQARVASRRYLTRALGRPARLSDLFRHYFTFATVALDRLYLLRERYDLFETRLHGEEAVQQALDDGRGCLLLGAHLGSFEILRALGTAKRLHLAMLMYEDNARKVGGVVRAINPALAKDVIALGRFDSMLKVHERLQDSHWVGILGDRALDDTGRLRVPFLGEPAAFPTAPFRIALMLKRPVVFMTGIYRGGRRYDLYFETLFEPDGIARSQRDAAIEAAVQRYVARLEWHCRDAPYNWFNFYDFWGYPPSPGPA